jgi:shikimate kinase
MSVVLVGMMGVGKTTLGRAAGKALGWKFIDLDREIEKASGRQIPDIFEQDGEPFFRNLESDALRRLAKTTHAVVSTGGGAPVTPGNLTLMRDIGPIVYLEASADALISRLKNSKAERPMLGKNIDERVRQLLDARSEVYRQADFRIPIDGNSPMQIVLEIKRIAEQQS